MSIFRDLLATVMNFFVALYREWRAKKDGVTEGRKEAAQEAQAKTIDNQQAAKEVKNEVQSLGDDDLKRRAGRWVRPKVIDTSPHSDQ